MSGPKKYVTFRDLKDLPSKDQTVSPDTSSTSISSTTSISNVPNNDLTAKASRVTQKKSKRTSKQPSKPVAPERDFQRVPNSVTRIALPDGIFRGKSKQVWDYLWSVSRGAVAPKRVVRKARKEIKAGAGLGSMVTVDAAIEHLQQMGLLAVRPAVGSLAGNEYEVFIPEEGSISPSRYTSTSSISRCTSLTHNLDDLDILDSSISSTTLVPLKSEISREPNTFFNTHDDDTHTQLAEFAEILLSAAQAILGKEVPNTERERTLWKECGCVLADELKRAAARTDSISSVPAFFTSHLRRCFAKNARNQSAALSDTQTTQADPDARPRNQQDKQSPTAARKEPQASGFTLEECRRYADHLRKSGQGINNPGGYATMIYRSGEADALIEKFLNPSATVPVDLTKCPDCSGTGFIYPEGIERGIVAKCKHTHLPVAIAMLAQIEQLRSLHSADEGYGPKALKEDLQNRCQRENLEWNEEVFNFLLNRV